MKTIQELINQDPYVACDGYDYVIQAWIGNHTVLDCAHPRSMKLKGCCNGHKYAGRNVLEVRLELERESVS